MEKIFVATVQLIIESGSEEDAHDVVNLILADRLADGTLKDWEYLKVGVHRLSPTRDYDLERRQRRQQTWAVAAG